MSSRVVRESRTSACTRTFHRTAEFLELQTIERAAPGGLHKLKLGRGHPHIMLAACAKP